MSIGRLPHAVNIKKSIHPFGMHLMYVGSIFTGLRCGPNDTGSPMYAGRLQWDLLNDEDNLAITQKMHTSALQAISLRSRLMCNIRRMALDPYCGTE